MLYNICFFFNLSFLIFHISENQTWFSPVKSGLGHQRHYSLFKISKSNLTWKSHVFLDISIKMKELIYKEKFSFNVRITCKNSPFRVTNIYCVETHIWQKSNMRILRFEICLKCELTKPHVEKNLHSNPTDNIMVGWFVLSEHWLLWLFLNWLHNTNNHLICIIGLEIVSLYCILYKMFSNNRSN